MVLKMPIDLPLNSRYLSSTVIKHNGVETIGMWSDVDWMDSAPAKAIVVSSSYIGRPDLIAHDYLGSIEYWWAIVRYNKVTDINWPKAGDRVLIPDSAIIRGG